MAPPGRVDVRHDGGVVQLDERLVDDGRLDRDRLAGLDALGRRRTSTGVGHAVDEPPQHLTPEVLVRLILERDRRVHLPLPRVLRR